MEKISDPSDFDHVIGIVREHARGLPDTHVEMIGLLGKLIEDALAELTGEKFATPRNMGDLDDADGITHLLADYPPAAPPGGFFHVAFLTTNEEAAARYLLKLYLARDFLQLGFGLPEDSISEIEATGRELLTWRLHGPAFQHGNDKAKQSRHQSNRARNPRKKTVELNGRSIAITKQEIERFRDLFIYEKGIERGWIKAACLEFGIDRKTLAKRMEE